MKIQLLYFEGCPNLEPARAALRDAMAAEQIDQPVEEVDVESPTAPASLRGWGSPTILIDGKDLTGAARATSSSCRLYASGAPGVGEIRARLVAARGAMRSCGEAPACRDGDLVRTRAAFLVWCVPAALVLVGVLWAQARAALWIPSFAVMGSACLVNARRCGRLHCHITGPLFLLAALVTSLDALAIVSVAWPWVLIPTVAGAALGYGLEGVRGLYVGRRATASPADTTPPPLDPARR
jgi:hypothetical protein